MSYFLKQTKIKNRVFLQISETTYSKINKKSSNKCFEKIGFLDNLIKQGIDDPISFYKEKVKELNINDSKRKEENKKEKISSKREKRIGYFLAKLILDSLCIKEKFYEFCEQNNFSTAYYDVFEDIIFSKVVSVYSSTNSIKNSHDFVPKNKNFSDEEIYNTLEFLGKYYQQISNILSTQVKKFLKINYENTFFDSFKSFFKLENNDICVTQSLLMDENVIPCGIRIDIGTMNSNSTTLSKIISDFQNKYEPKKIIRVADRGINYGNNIYNSIINNCGYIFPISAHSLIDADKEWILKQENYESLSYNNGEYDYKLKEDLKEQFIKIVKNDKTVSLLKARQKRVATFSKTLHEKKKADIYRLVDQANILFYSNAQKNDYGKSLKYISIIRQEGQQDKIKINTEKINEELKFAGYKMIVTSEENYTKENIFYIYDNVWKIEDYFRFLKNYLNSEPELTKTTNRMAGCLLSGFYIITIYRIIENKIFKSKYPLEVIYEFVKNIKFLETNNNFINLLSPSQIVIDFENIFNISLSNVFYEKSQINNFFKLKLKN